MSAVSVMIERLRRSSPGRVQMLPQAYCVISSWKSRVKSVVAAVARSGVVQLGQHSLGDPERGVRVRHAAVDGGLQEKLLDLVVGHAVGARCPEVHGELFVVAPGDQRGQRNQ